MDLTLLWVLCSLIFIAALAYSAVGQAGATGYLAAMALVGLAPEVMKPSALVLNALVAAWSTWHLHRAGRVYWRRLAPLLAASVPAALIGGAIQLDDTWYRYLVGLLLIASALILGRGRSGDAASTRSTPAPMPALPAAVLGGGIGLLSGLTGTGGGIFLAPALLLFTWAHARSAPGMTAPFNLLNSCAALTGNVIALGTLPGELPYFMVAAVAGAAIGTQLGMSWLSERTLQRMLCVILFAAGVRFMIA